MSRKGFLCILMVGWLLAPLICRGQEEGAAPGRWWYLPKVAEKLNLSDEQKRRLDDLFLNNRRKLIDLKSVVERERLELDALLTKEPLDEAGIMAQFKKLETAQNNLAVQRFGFFLEVRKMLGAERFLMLETFGRGMREIMRQGRMDRNDSLRPELQRNPNSRP